MLGLETLILFSSIYSAAFLRIYPNQMGSFDTLLVNASIIGVITPIAMLSTGLYQGNTREGIAGILIRISVSFVAAIIITAIIAYLVPDIILGRGIIALAFIQSFFIIGIQKEPF